MAKNTERERVEDLAVSSFDLVGELVEGIAQATQRLIDHVHVKPVPKRPAFQFHPAAPPPPDRRHLALLDYPRIDSEWPLGPCLHNPMGEGSDDSAVPLVDPVDVRLGLTALPEPLP